MLEELRKYRNAMPFVPYTIHLRDGRLMHITDPYHVAFGGKGRLVVVYQENTDEFLSVDSRTISELSLDPVAKE